MFYIKMKKNNLTNSTKELLRIRKSGYRTKSHKKYGKPKLTVAGRTSTNLLLNWLALQHQVRS
jgi:hypothetical protein